MRGRDGLMQDGGDLGRSVLRAVSESLAQLEQRLCPELQFAGFVSESNRPAESTDAPLDGPGRDGGPASLEPRSCFRCRGDHLDCPVGRTPARSLDQGCRKGGVELASEQILAECEKSLGFVRSTPGDERPKERFLVPRLQRIALHQT